MQETEELSDGDTSRTIDGRKFSDLRHAQVRVARAFGFARSPGPVGDLSSEDGSSTQGDVVSGKDPEVQVQLTAGERRCGTTLVKSLARHFGCQKPLTDLEISTCQACKSRVACSVKSFLEAGGGKHKEKQFYFR